MVLDSSEPFEKCPHIASQCGGNEIIIGNNYTEAAGLVRDLESSEYNLNQPYKINLNDDANWR